jgi:ubiquinone/menaquinone biosynthesis C-methylase UbiE
MEVRSGAGDDYHDRELTRIAAAYRDRDANSAANVYRFSNPGYAFYMQTLEWALLDTLRRAPVDLDAARVLDVGCGEGYFLHRLMEFGAAQAVGIDLMPERVEAARRRYPDLRFIRANAAELPFADGEFDVVTQFTCLSSVLDPGLRRAIASEMWRVLRPGGVVVSYDMRPPAWPVRVLRSLGEQRRRRSRSSPDVVTPTTGISADELRRLFPAASLHHRSVGLAFGLCGIARHSRFAAQLLVSLPPLREHGIGVIVKPPLREDAAERAS